MKRTPLVIALLFLVSLLATPTAISFSGCPDSWEVKLPNIKFESRSGINYRFISFDGDLRTGMEYQTFRLASYYPELNNYAKTLGPDAVMSLEFEIDDKPDFKTKMVLPGEFSPYAYQIDNARLNAGLGIPSDPWLRTSIKIEVKNCKTSTFVSNSIQAKSNYVLENLDDFFKRYGSTFYNFKQEELLRKALSKNYTEISSPSVLKNLVGGGRYIWKTEDDGSLNRETDYYFNGLSPAGCFRKTPNLEWTKVISFNSLPCKVGVFFNESSAGGHLVQIMDFKALPAPTPTATPTATATATPTTSKKTTINCVKGKLAKKVTAVNPKCPSGYKVKK